MNSNPSSARTSALRYLLILSLAPVVHLGTVRRFLVHEDPAATAGAILADPTGYRLGILAGVAADVLFLVVALRLLRLLTDGAPRRARVVRALGSAAIAVGVVNLFHQMVPLLLLGGAGFGSRTVTPPLEAVAYAFLELHRIGVYLALALWSLCLVPLGVRVFRSGFLPRPLGVLLIAGGFAYVGASAAAIVLPHPHVMDRCVLPFYTVLELGTIGVLLLRGAKEPSLVARASHAV